MLREDQGIQFGSNKTLDRTSQENPGDKPLGCLLHVLCVTTLVYFSFLSFFEKCCGRRGEYALYATSKYIIRDREVV